MSEILTPTIINASLSGAGSETVVTLPVGCKNFSLQCRTAVDVRLAFTANEAKNSGTYITVKSGQAFTTPDKAQVTSSLTVYLAAASAVIVEVICWS